jgi:parvulin-like peptidyl-prolyl isomerase
MGREAYFGGSLQAVAREKSQEPFAKEGGVHDWTAQGALASDALDKQIFSIPLNAMSEIIEDDLGFHIIRVLERQQAGVTPLSEVQDEIRATLRQEKIAKSQREVMENMKVMIPVWSLFPDDTPGAKPLPESIARRNPATKQR